MRAEPLSAGVGDLAARCLLDGDLHRPHSTSRPRAQPSSTGTEVESPVTAITEKCHALVILLLLEKSAA